MCGCARAILLHSNCTLPRRCGMRRIQAVQADATTNTLSTVVVVAFCALKVVRLLSDFQVGEAYKLIYLSTVLYEVHIYCRVLHTVRLVTRWYRRGCPDETSRDEPPSDRRQVFARFFTPSVGLLGRGREGKDLVWWYLGPRPKPDQTKQGTSQDKKGEMKFSGEEITSSRLSQGWHSHGVTKEEDCTVCSTEKDACTVLIVLVMESEKGSTALY